MRQTMLRGGIAGCGAVMTTTHMPGWRTVKDAEILAACDPREEAAIETARRWGIPSTYGDFSQMLKSEKLDFVDICSPPYTHSQLAIQAMEAGLHVLVEKPMSVGIGEADEMVATAKKCGIKLCVFHNFLFDPVIQIAKSLVDSGTIGELLTMEVHSLDRRERHLSQENHWCHNLPGGIFGEYVPHIVYLVLAFLGNIRSVRVIARKYSEFPWVAADELKVLVEAESSLGAFTVSCNSPRDSFTLDLFGTKRNVHVDHLTQTITHRRPRSNKFHDLILDRSDLILPVFTAAAYSTVNRLRGRQRNRLGHQAIIQKFIESLQNNTDPPVTGEDGRETIRILEEIWKQIS